MNWISPKDVLPEVDKYYLVIWKNEVDHEHNEHHILTIARARYNYKLMQDGTLEQEDDVIRFSGIYGNLHAQAGVILGAGEPGHLQADIPAEEFEYYCAITPIDLDLGMRAWNRRHELLYRS